MSLLAIAFGLLQTQDAEYFPLKPGNEWSYTVSNGLAMTVRVTGTARVRDTECIVVETTMGPQTNREYLALTADGLKALKMENPAGAVEFPAPVLRVKLPFKKGDAWTATIQEGFATNTYHYRTEGAETLKLASGAVECWKISTTLQTVQGRMTVTNWYGKGVGLVQQVYDMNGLLMKAELVKAPVKPAEAKPAAAPAAGGDVVRYESRDGKALLFHPAGWRVEEAGERFGPGTYALAVEEPDQSAGVLFMTFTVGEQLADSVALANLLLGNLKRAHPDLEVGQMSSTQDRARTSAAAGYTADGKAMSAHFYFFHTNRVGTLYALMARKEKWEASRPTLASIVANLAYAPEGVAKVLQRGRETAAAPPPAADRIQNPAAMIKEAMGRPGKQLELAQAVAQDQSFSMAVPRGWVFQGQGLNYIATSDARMIHAFYNSWHQITTPDSPLAPYAQGPKSRYLPPLPALAYALASYKIGGNIKVLSAGSIGDLDRSYADLHAQWRAQGSSVESVLVYVEFTHAATGGPCRGIFSVTCLATPMGGSWSCVLAGSWAPAAEYADYIPLFAKMAGTVQQNKGWVDQKFQAQAAESARLNRNLMTSLNDVNKAFDRYNQSWWDSQKSRDYTSWAHSQTTLGQGSWVSEREGAEVVRSASWGLENTQTGERTSAWNHTNFTGRNPWSGEQLNEVSTRGEFERYLRNR